MMKPELISIINHLFDDEKFARSPYDESEKKDALGRIKLDGVFGTGGDNSGMG